MRLGFSTGMGVAHEAMLSHWHKLPPALLYQQKTNLDEEPGCFSEMVCFPIAKQQLRLGNEHNIAHTGQPCNNAVCKPILCSYSYSLNRCTWAIIRGQTNGTVVWGYSSIALSIFSFSSRWEAYLASRVSISFTLCCLASSTAWSHWTKHV